MITHLRHVDLAVPDFGRQLAFYAGTWGLTTVASDRGIAFLAAEGSPERYVLRLRKDQAKRLDLVAFGAASAAEVDALAARLIERGITLAAEPGRLKTEGGGYGLRFFDLDGRTIEVSADVATRRHRKIEERESIPVRLSHVVLNSADPDATARWYSGVLGFRLSDTLAGPETGTVMARRAAAVQRRVPVLQVLVLAALVLYVGAKDGDYTWGDLWSPILLQASFLGIAAAGQTLAILVGGLDFSIAAYIVAGNLLTTHLVGLEHWNFAACALIVLAVCLAGGGLSGWLCHRFGLEPLVVTLGMSSVVVGALLGTDSKLVNGAGPGWLQSFTAQSSKTLWLPLPPVITAWIVLAVVISVILARTPLGRRLYLAGSGPRAAEIAGISTRRVWTGVYAASAVLAGLAGVLLAGFSTGGDVNVGNNYLFPGLAAVIVGGTMMGGRGDYLRTCLGALIITALNFVISVLNVNAAAAHVVFGALILATVALYGRERRLRDRV